MVGDPATLNDFLLMQEDKKKKIRGNDGNSFQIFITVLYYCLWKGRNNALLMGTQKIL